MGLTEGIIENTVTLNGNGDSLFNITSGSSGQVIEPNENLPIQATNFKITSSNSDIAVDSKNAVNKSYLDEQTYTKAQTDSLLDDKANTSDVYSKTEAGEVFETISAHNADKATLQAAIDAKANSADVYSKSQVYTKTETDNKYIQSAEYGSQLISNTLNVRHQVLTPIVEVKRFQGFVRMGEGLVLNGEGETRFTPTVPEFQLDKGVQYTFTATIETESENIKISNLPYVRMGGDFLDITQGSISGNSYIATATPSSNIFPSDFYFGIRNGDIDKTADDSAEVELTITHGGDYEYQNSSLKNYIQTESTDVCLSKADIITTSDSTSAEDSNVYSASKADELFEPKSSLQANYYDKTAVDGIRTAIVAAADSKYVQIANVGSLTLPSSINISYTTSGQGEIVDFETDEFVMDGDQLYLMSYEMPRGPLFADSFRLDALKAPYTITIQITNETTNFTYNNIKSGYQMFFTTSGSSYGSGPSLYNSVYDDNTKTITSTITAANITNSTLRGNDLTVGLLTYPLTTASETSAKATIRVTHQGTVTETHILSLGNYIKYLINNN